MNNGKKLQVIVMSTSKKLQGDGDKQGTTATSGGDE